MEELLLVHQKQPVGGVLQHLAQVQDRVEQSGKQSFHPKDIFIPA